MNFKLKTKFGTKTIYLISSEDDVLIGTLPESILRLFLRQPIEFIKVKGFELNEQELENILQAIKKHAWNKLCKYLTMQDHTEWECQEYLRKIPTTQKLNNDLIQLAKKHRFIQDERTAENYVLSMINRGLTANECRYKLALKRVDEQIINTLIDQYYTNSTNEEIILKHLEKAKRKYSNLPNQKQKEKILSYLYRKGITYSEISLYFDDFL